MNENRVEALRQAVVARQEDDTPDSIVARAEAFYAFLNENRPKVVAV